MAEPTGRDRVWKNALGKAVQAGKPVEPADIADTADVSERMARQCLIVMSQSGWLERRTKLDGSVRYVCPSNIEYKHET
jgi:MarR-like DNA-binding transcriptional regulator SgrR of sgrS sRNA